MIKYKMMQAVAAAAAAFNLANISTVEQYNKQKHKFSA
jgi:hypothetical protein